MYHDSLQHIGEISPATWPKWEGLLPKVVADLSGVAIADFYLDSTVPRANYKLNGIIAILTDPAKLATFQQWVKITDALKMVVSTYRGADAAVWLETFDTRLGDAPELWRKLKEWYRERATGSEKVVSLTMLLNTQWDGVEAPGVHVARLLSLRSRLNAAYKADTLKHPDQEDSNTKADITAAISGSLLQNLFLSSIPDHYFKALQPSSVCSTTFTQAVALVNNLFMTRQSRELIAEIEAASRVSVPAPTQVTHPSTPVQDSRPRGNWGNGRGGHGHNRGMKKKSAKLPATKYPGYEQWRGGTFEDWDRVVQFRVPVGMYFSCFREGHMSRDCPTENKARARVDELRCDRIQGPINDAMALHTFDCNINGEIPDHAALAALHTM
ncbi:hypothetical protein JCM1841_000747 [Sporobolomyces salmonicolor]